MKILNKESKHVFLRFYLGFVVEFKEVMMEENLQNQEINQFQPLVETDRKKWLKIALFTLGGLILLAGIFYAGMKFNDRRSVVESQPFSTPTPKSYPREIPTEPPAVEATKTPVQIEKWQTYSFEVARDNIFEIKVPEEWNVESKARSMRPVPGEIEYWTDEQLKKLEERKFTETLNISKDGYILNIHFPAGFGMDFCFYPGAPAFPPYYSGEADYDFGTLKEFERLSSQYGQYLRGKTVLPVESGLHKDEFKNMFYVKTCEKEINTANYSGSIKGGFFTYYFPASQPGLKYLQIMDEILKSFHSK